MDSEMSEKVIYYDPNNPEPQFPDEHHHTDTEHIPRARIYCGGLCMAGPPSGSWPPIGILLLQVYHVAFNICTFTFLLMNNFPRLAVAFGFTTFFGLWGILLFVMSWFSDPGIITYHDDTSSEKAQLEYASYDSDEKPFTAVCPIYKNEMYYKLRAC